MIKYNEEYSINNGQGTIVFTEGNKGIVNAEYDIKGNKGKGKINGALENNVLTGTFHVDAAAGLIEFTFTENGFEAKWKQGIEHGPMKGKWTGSMKSQSESNQSINEKTSLSPEQLKWIEEKSRDYEKVPKEWLDSKEFMLAAVNNDGRDLEFASDQLNGDAEIVLTAMSQDADALYYVRSEVILKELAENSSVGGTKINFKVRDLVSAVEKLFGKKLFDEDGDVNDEIEKICNDWFDFNQIIYQNQTMDGDALLSLAQVQFNKYRPSSTDDGGDVEEYTRGLLIEAIELNDEAMIDIIWQGLNPQEYLDFSDLAEKACELLWNREEKNYANALMVLRNDNHELIPGLSNEFVLKIIQETRDSDIGEEEDKEEFENFVSEAGLD